MGLMDFFKNKTPGPVYKAIDAEGLDIQITQTESEGNNGIVPALYANIPIKDIKHSNNG